MNKRDLVIIGGGAGGLVVASVASQLGLKVTLIEKNEKLGGDCLRIGCVPSKTLIHAAKVASLVHRGGQFGLDALAPMVDYPTLAQIHRRTVNTLYGKRLFSAATRGLVRWVNRLLP